FGTNRPSITSTCRTPAPPSSMLRISSANREKSADNIEGAISNIQYFYFVAGKKLTVVSRFKAVGSSEASFRPYRYAAEPDWAWLLGSARLQYLASVHRSRAFP